ncbi:hypothetical protein Tco_1067033 [Tanacetum coccineum]|uniref:Reverse transcriptase domain-containing protein n=1 Tax=Tanacetum coccineum TaxID=301880 RepID=A0ABQ5HD43_9ASTR
MNALPRRSLIEKEKLNGTNFLDWHELEDYSSMKESWTSLRHPFLTLLLMMLLLLSMTHELQKDMEDRTAYNMLCKLKTSDGEDKRRGEFHAMLKTAGKNWPSKNVVPSLHMIKEWLRTVKSIPPKCRLGFSRVLKEALDKVICTPDDISCWSFPGGSLQLMRETLAESSSLLSDVHEEYINLGEGNINQCRRKICVGTLHCLEASGFQGGEAITQVVNRLIEDCGDDVDLSMLLVDFKNAFNLVDREIILRGTHLTVMPRGEVGLGIRMMALLLEIGVLKKASELVMDLWT